MKTKTKKTAGKSPLSSNELLGPDDIIISITSTGGGKRSAGFTVQSSCLTDLGARLTGMVASAVEECFGQWPPRGVQAPPISAHIHLPKAGFHWSKQKKSRK
jgi:hypothetical protein